MQRTIRLEGMTGLVMHNIRLASERDEYTRAIKAITSKRKKTDADYDEIERLEWFGGLYHDAETGIHIPSQNIVRCLEEGGKVNKLGKSVIRSLIPLTDRVPLTYSGSTDLKRLYEQPEYVLRLTVGVQRAKVTRVRPIFRSWSAELTVEHIDEVLNFDDLQRIVELAGRIEGIGDARKLGYGRFRGSIQ